MTGERRPHLPRPTYAPALLALGLMTLLWGAVTTWVISAVGLILTGLASVRWIRDLSAEPHIALAEAEKKRGPEERAAARVKTAASDETVTYQPGLHWYAMLLSACTLALLVTGALVTSHDLTPSALLKQTHLIAGIAVGLLSLGLALWTAKGPAVSSRLGWLVVAGAVVLSVLGRPNIVVAVFHAWLAQLFFALTVVVALVTSQSWIHPVPVEAPGRLRLPMLSLVAVVLMLLQVGMGAAVRHRAMGAVPHIVGALVVTIVLLLTAILVTNQVPEHAALHPAAKTLIGLTFTQVMLGMGAFITRLMAEESSLAVVIPSVSHVATGSLTLAATVTVALLIRRCAREVG